MKSPNAKGIGRASLQPTRHFKAAAIGAVAALAVSTGFLGSQALACTSSQTFSKVLIGPRSGQPATRAARQNWIDLSVSQVENKLGQPSQGYEQVGQQHSAQCPLIRRSWTISKVLVGPLSGQPTIRAARHWIGDSVSQVENKLGRPSQDYRLKDTGGEMLIYTYPYAKHYVFYAEKAR